MALLCLKLPSEPARRLSEVKVPGKKVPLDEKHVTLLHLGKDLDLEAILLAIQVTYQVVTSWSPFLLTTQWISTFPPSERSEVPVIARVESDDLHELQEELKDAFDEEGVPYSKKWKSYQPHVTLSYTDLDLAPEDFTIRPVQWSCSDIVLWGGDEGESDLVTRFPLSLSMGASSKYASREGSTKDHLLRPYVKMALWSEKLGRSWR